MKIKTYGIYGMVEHSVVLQFGTGKIRLDFTHGCLSGSVEPAKYRTKNILVQKAIEGSDKYKRGVIKLLSEETVAEPKSVKAESVVKSDVAVTDFPNVMNSQSAKSVLMSMYNIPLNEMPNKEAIKAKAKELNVTFSNWN